jgi:hypothetical protein
MMKFPIGNPGYGEPKKGEEKKETNEITPSFFIRPHH